MEIKILQVFYDKNGLPYKDKERQVHFPIVGNAFQGASNTTKIRFYYNELDMNNETTFVAVSKLPNGKIGSKILNNFLDEELNENYALLELDSFYTQVNGDLFISLQGYQGGVRVEQDEQGIYQIYGTPTIQATGSIKLSINYATQFVGSGEEENVTLQRIFAYLGTKLGIRATTELVSELPTIGQTDVFYAIYNDPQDTNKLNIYVWNETTQEYVWVGDNTLDLGDYYTKEEGEQFEEGIDARVSSVENELSSVASGSPKGVYATLSDLETAYPTGTDGIYVVSADGHWYYWNGGAWADGGLYQSSSDTKRINDILASTEYNSYRRLFVSAIENGTPWNTSNAYCIRTTEYTPVKAGDSIFVNISNYKLQEGHYLKIGYSKFDANKNFLSYTGLQSNNPFTLSDTSAKFLQFAISEYDESDNQVVIRKDQFESGVFVLIYDKSDYIAKKIDNLEYQSEIMAYFSDGKGISLSITKVGGLITSANVTFPSSGTYFRLYRMDGTKIIDTASYSGQTYTLGQAPSKLVFDLSDNSIKSVNLSSTPANYITLLENHGNCIGGGLLDAYIRDIIINEQLLEPKNAIFDNNVRQIYCEYDQFYVEQDLKNKKVYFKFSAVYVRLGTNVTLTDAQFSSQTGMERKTSTLGIANCFELDDAYTIVFNTSNEFELKARTNVTYQDIVVISQVGGRIIQTNDGLLSNGHIYTYFKNRVSPNELEYYFNSRQNFWRNVAYNSNFKFVFFSDVHAQQENMQRIVNFANSMENASMIDAIINGGDTVSSNLDDGYSWYQDYVDKTSVDVLTCVGNHDEMYPSYGQPATNAQIYSAFIEPMVSKVDNIVQPENAATNGLCYYYKDYNDVRVIVLDAMENIGIPSHWNSAQETWLANVLADALTNNKHVLCVNHCPYGKNDSGLIRNTNSRWNSWKSYSITDGSYISNGALNAVKTFINNGGNFICWLTGHTHFDNILENENYQGQFMISIATANQYNHRIDGAYNTPKDSGLYDCFNYMAIDTTNSVIKVFRIGYNIDGGMKERNILCYNYETKNIIWEN